LGDVYKRQQSRRRQSQRSQRHSALSSPGSGTEGGEGGFVIRASMYALPGFMVRSIYFARRTTWFGVYLQVSDAPGPFLYG
ncbi:hypothetical protein ACFWAY_49615, partial [Rhodococcus sp. NPDC059968]|uniref:hypothetical protein n=1 Tax=Rhodococcus sp. NPDC059968 TaxID=3347017 RepID=UPI00366D42AA